MATLHRFRALRLPDAETLLARLARLLQPELELDVVAARRAHCAA